jgi:Uracil DNA glycosylase superfamily
MTALDDLYLNLDSVRPYSCCSELCLDTDYTPVYVGPSYGRLQKILFVGQDSGKCISQWAGRTCTTEKWSRLVFDDRRGVSPKETLSAHLAGCVWATAVILRLSCDNECRTRCSNKNIEACALANFAQTNAVKCVDRTDTRKFRAHHRIGPCMKHNLFREIEALKPDLIALQGRDRKTGHIHEDFRREIEAQKRGHRETRYENVDTMDWKSTGWTGRSVIASLAHPSAIGKALTQQARDKERQILLQARQLLDAKATSAG